MLLQGVAEEADVFLVNLMLVRSTCCTSEVWQTTYATLYAGCPREEAEQFDRYAVETGENR